MNRTMFQAKKMLPEYVFDTAKLEGNPLTFPEVQTLLDGITVGGHKISDMQQVLNLQAAWKKAFKYAAMKDFSLTKEVYCDINDSVSFGESLDWGTFRTGNVGIAGTTTYKAPEPEQLDSLFNAGLNDMLRVSDATERALRLFLWGAYCQFFWDGNKRTNRIIANIVLMRADAGVFNIRPADILEFNKLMVGYYDSNNMNDVLSFLMNRCIVKIWSRP